jgi:hypothetical protein
LENPAATFLRAEEMDILDTEDGMMIKSTRMIMRAWSMNGEMKKDIRKEITRKIKM